MRPADWGALRRGFTLIELVVALFVSGIVLLGARLMVEQLSAAAHQVLLAARDADRVANADHLLRSIVGRTETGRPFDRPFGGNGQSVHFTTWCDSPSGWLERCDALLAIEDLHDTNALVLHLAPRGTGGRVRSDVIRLSSGFRVGAFRYLNDPAAGGVWFSQWGDGGVAPPALGIILDGDTTIVRIRGSF